MARKKGSTDYSLEIKLEAIRLAEEEGLPYKDITEQLGIRDPGRVKRWMGIYRREGSVASKSLEKAGLKKIWTVLKSGSGGWRWRTPF